MATNKAQFSIDGNAASNFGYDATTSQVLDLVLEDAADVQRVTYYIYDPANPESPLASKDATLINFAGGQKSESPSVPTGTVQITMPGSPGYSYVLRAIAVTGSGNHTFERLVAIRKSSLRAVVPFESTQYSTRGWADAWSEYVLAVGLVSGPGTAVDNTLRWSGSAWVETTVLKVGTNVTISANIDLANTSQITFDSSPGGTRVVAMKLDATENLYVGTSGANGATAIIYDAKTSGLHDFRINNVTEALLSATALDLQNNNLVTTGFGSFGATPATTGFVRLPLNAQVVGKNDVTSANMIMLAGYTGGHVQLGGSGAEGATAVSVDVRTGGNFTVYVNGVGQLVVNDTTVDCQNNNILTTGYVAIGTGPTVGSLRLASGSAVIGGSDKRALVIDGSGNLFIGTADSGPGTDAANTVLGATTSVQGRIGGAIKTILQSTGVTMQQSSADATAIGLAFSKDRGGTPVVISGDEIGRLDFFGHDGTGQITRSRVLAIVNGSVSTGNVPMDLVFYAGSTALTERMRLTSGGALNLHNGTNANFDIQCNGEVAIGLNIASGVRNIAFFAAGSTNFNSGDKVLFLSDADAAPTANPSAGVYVYAGSTDLFVRGAFASTTTRIRGFTDTASGGTAGSIQLAGGAQGSASGAVTAGTVEVRGGGCTNTTVGTSQTAGNANLYGGSCSGTSGTRTAGSVNIGGGYGNGGTDGAVVIEVYPGSGTLRWQSNATGIGLYGATPIAQHTSTGETAGFTAGGGTTVTDASTFTGNVGTKAYRISDVVRALKNIGLMASS